MRKVLALAPYESLGEQFSRAAESYAGSFSLDVRVLNLQEAGDYIAAAGLSAYDAIISRGGTASLLKKTASLPVVEVEVSVYDMLRVIKLAEQYGGPFAIIGFENVTRVAKTVCDILAYSIPIYQIQSEAEAETVLRSLPASGTLVVGDVITSNTAKSLGISSILITSGTESVEKALGDCASLFSNFALLQGSASLYKSALENDPDIVLLLREDGTRLYQNRELPPQQQKSLMALAEKMLPEISGPSLRLIRRRDFMQYDVCAARHFQSGVPFYSLHIRLSPLPKKEAPAALRVLQIPPDFSPPGLLPGSSKIRPLLAQADQIPSHAPLLLSGAMGTGKDDFAQYIHAHGPQASSSFLQVDCASLTEKNLAGLIDDINSPLHAAGCTLYFRGLHLLSFPAQQRLEEYARQTLLCRRHRVLSSSWGDLPRLLAQGAFSPQLYEMFCGFDLCLPSLAERREDIRSICSLLLNECNRELGRQVTGFQPEAFRLLEAFPWPGNLRQLRRTVQSLVLSAQGSYISAGAVRSVLQEQPRFSPDGGIDLSKTLEEMEKEILSLVLRQEDMNQSRAAKRLGISRSTLWRKLSP